MTKKQIFIPEEALIRIIFWFIWNGPPTGRGQPARVGGFEL